MGCPLRDGRTEKNRKILLPFVSGGACCGECHEVQVPTGTECPCVRMYLDATAGLWGLGHIVAGILCVLDRTNVGSIPFATFGASKRLPFNICI